MSNVTTADTSSAPWETLGIAAIPISQVNEALDIVWEMESRTTLCLIGPTGVGKTPILKAWAESKGATYIRTFNTAHMSADALSMTMFTPEGTSYRFLAPEDLHELNAAAERDGISMLFFDEWNRGDKAAVNALFTLTDERRFNGLELHPNVVVVAAMNPSDAGYMVNQAERDPAIRKRLCLLYTTTDIASVLAYGKAKEWFPGVLEYLTAQPNRLYDESARDAGKAFPCPANWEKASNYLHAATRLGKDLGKSHAVFAMLAGQVGYTDAETFQGFLHDKNTVIAPAEVLEEYRDKARRRVAALFGIKQFTNAPFDHTNSAAEVRIDALNNLNAAIAAHLFGTRPDAERVVPHLAAYMQDLNDELLLSLMSNHFQRESQRVGAAGGLYVKGLYQLLVKEAPDVSARVAAVTASASKSSND